MKPLLLALCATLALTAPALALDAFSDAAVAKLKPGKPIKIGDVATFMRGSEKWCYAQQDDTCGWTDIYLDVGDTDVQYEGGAAWNEDTDAFIVHAAALKDNRYICEVPENPTPTTRAISRRDGHFLFGRELANFKKDVEPSYIDVTQFNCFDYTFVSVSPDHESLVIRQRQWLDGVTDKANDVDVTLHFDPVVAEKLTLRY